MKIEYKVLWLDDKINEFIEDDHVEEVNKYIEELNFHSKIDTVKTPEDLYRKLDDSYDLILTDYHLGTINGDEVVQKIRERSILTEILFYTAKADLVDASKIDRISFLETNQKQGNHHQNVIKKIKTLIDLTVKKFQNIIVMRGMLMHETSELDNQKEQLIKNYISQQEPVTTNEFKGEIINKISQHFTSKLGKLNNEWAIKPNGLNNLMKDSFVFSSDYKISALSWILDELKTDNFSNDYKEDIVKIRNKFAHAILHTNDENGKQFFKHGDENIIFDDEFCKTIRKSIIKHKNNLNSLQQKIEASTTPPVSG